ncbi:MAG: GNAT family N-acetyltransferase [Oscillospiraceae bacterium]|nr:GNAT family N-acetyltransferase [Oscillospiraceae bacterium]
MNNTILMYEELSFNAHPALQTQFYDGWILRFANGYTGRANSVSPLYPSTLDLREKIAECEKRYISHGLATLFKLTDGSDPKIEKMLDALGYTIVTPTYVMRMDLRDTDFQLNDCVITSYADKEWLDAFYSFSHYTGSVLKSTTKQILENVKNTTICGRIVKDGVSVACGSAVMERGYMALLNIVVDETQRGKGYGAAICESLLSAAKNLGAHTAYLQVEQGNARAVSLYTKLGYRPIYSYWYRVKKTLRKDYKNEIYTL